MMVLLCSHVNVSVKSRLPSLVRSNYIFSMHTVQPHSKTDRRKRPGRRRITSDGINRTYSAQDRRIQRAHIHDAHGDLHERREVRGVRTSRAHSADAREAAAHAAAARHSVVRELAGIS